MSNNLGKLVRHLKDRCDECGKPLELRRRSESGKDTDYKYCPNCDSESRPVRTKTYSNPYTEGDFIE